MSHSDPEIPRLFAVLDSADKREIRAAVDRLIILASDSADLRKTLAEQLDNHARKNRWPVAYVLAGIGELSPRILEVLIDTLGDRDPDIRWAVLLLLVRVGKRDERIAAALAQIVENGDPTQRRMAQYCIRDLGLRGDSAIAASLKGLDDPEALVRVAAIIALKRRTQIPDIVTQRIVDLFLKDPDPRVRSTAVVILAEIKTISQEFLAGLDVARQSENPQIKKAANAAFALLQK